VFLATGENEANVRYALDKWPLKLVQQPLVLGGPGLSGHGWLTAAEAQLVQRFDPGAEGQGQDDTIGFFVAKFVKQRSTL
jgi:16S rRNA C967 or C1407 C5-methylase (RsmB/RsmF family)